MKPSHDSPEPSSDEELAQALTELEANVATLRQRHTAVNQAQAEKKELRVRINRAQSELRQHRTQQLQDELKSLQSRMEDIELILESQLLTWGSFKEPFWQIVRFGGVGIVIGWFLHSLT